MGDVRGRSGALVAGVDVGTASVRCLLTDPTTGRRVGHGERRISVWRGGDRPADFAAFALAGAESRDLFLEQSADEIWERVCLAVADAAKDAARLGGGDGEIGGETCADGAAGGDDPDPDPDPGAVEAVLRRVRGVGFDATCSLVVLDGDFRPVTVSPSGDDARNVVLWADHRALDQAEAINATGHEALEGVGGAVSPEMQFPKVLWIKERMPESWSRAAHFMDLADYLTWRASGDLVRSVCTVTCKWQYKAHGASSGLGCWDTSFLEAIGLKELADDGFSKIGSTVKAMGAAAGAGLTQAAARETGLPKGAAVAVSAIDAHAGGIGILGCTDAGLAAFKLGEASFAADVSLSCPVERVPATMCVIWGTSTCHMAVSGARIVVPGVWGPFAHAMVPGLWLTEGGQSATGAAVDFIVNSHAHSKVAGLEASDSGMSLYQYLTEHLQSLAAAAAGSGDAPPSADTARELSMLTRSLHVLPDFNGNRSPLADPHMRGSVVGLSLDSGLDALAKLFLATVQGAAYGTRHVIDALAAAGMPRVRTLIVTGGAMTNPMAQQELANITGCDVVLPESQNDSVCLGAAVLAAIASGEHASFHAAGAAMARSSGQVSPTTDDALTKYHDRKYSVYRSMQEDAVRYRGLMDA